MKFKQFIDSNKDFEFSLNKKETGVIKIDEYLSYLQVSRAGKKPSKELKQRIYEMKGEIPYLHNESEGKYKFYMVNLSSGQTREVKSRGDKTYAGSLLSGIFVTEMKENPEQAKVLQESKYNWNLPDFIFSLH